jgi:hypothetical protein
LGLSLSSFGYNGLVLCKNPNLNILAAWLAETEHIFDDGAERLIIGSGQEGNVKLSDEADHCFKEKAAPLSFVRRRKRSRSGTKPKAKPSPCSM